MRTHFLANLLLILCFSKGYCAEYDSKKIQHYASQHRVTLEAREYILSLNDADYKRLVDEYHFDNPKDSRNTHLFAFVFRKTEDMKRRGVSYDENYVLERSIAIVKAYDKAKDANWSSSLMYTLDDYDHPLLLEIANNLLKHDQPSMRRTGQHYLEKRKQRLLHEKWKKNRSRRVDDFPSNQKQRSTTHGQATTDEQQSNTTKKQWLTIIATLSFFAIVWLIYKYKRA